MEQDGDRLSFASQAKTWRGQIPVEFLYTVGPAGERLFKTLRESGRLAATHCQACRRTYLPPRIYCQECFADLAESWKEVVAVGTVHTYAVLHLDRDGRPLEAPEVVAYVQIDGTDGGLVTRLLDVDHDRVAIGLPVEAVLLPARERRGAITDIQGFRPRRGGTP